MKSSKPFEEAEQDVLEDAADAFTAEALDRGDVIDATPVARTERGKGKRKAIVIVLGVAAVAAVAAGALMKYSPTPEPSPLLAELEAMDAPASGSPPAETAQTDPAPAERALAGAAHGAYEAENPAPGPAVAVDAATGVPVITANPPASAQPASAQPASAQPAPASPLPAETASVAAALSAAPASAGPLSVSPIPESPASADSVAALAAAEKEINRLKLEVDTLRKAAQPRAASAATRIQVVEVLNDGVVLRGPDGRTVIAPSGSSVVAAGSRVTEGSR